jgi:hypothetical protein
MGNTISSLVSGAILILLGLIFYKKLRKKETIGEAMIDKEIKIQFIVNEFKRMRMKYPKPLSMNSHSTQLEQELSDIYGYCDEIKDHCKGFNLPIDSDLNLLMNHVYAQKGVLYFNNQVRIANEKIPLFQTINKTELEGVKYNRDAGKQVYYDLYNEYEKEIQKLIEQGVFFKKYWKY